MKKSSFGKCVLTISTAALLLSGCSKGEVPRGAGGAIEASPMVAAPAMDAVAPAGEVREAAAIKQVVGSNAETKTSLPSPENASQLMLAYTYNTSFNLPNNNVLSLKKAHEAKCAAAGPSLCQIVQSSSDTSEGATQAMLSLRAAPAWLTSFRAGLDADAKGANGKIAAQNVTSEDLTRSITDHESRLRALKTLRTRLEALIASRPGKLSDLLEVERELARVQGEIDSFESTVAVMRGRVNMSSIDMTYSSRPPAVEAGAFSPLFDALRGFFGVAARSLAGIITLLAAILPFALVLVPLGYFVQKWRREQAVKKRSEAEKA